MSNGARHALGLVVGLIATPVLLLGVGYVIDRVSLTLRIYASPPVPERLFWAAALIGLGVLLALLVASRLSPLASLVPGVFFGGLGLLWIVSFRLSFDLLEFLPRELARGLSTVGGTGMLLLLGALLLMASLPPSRWRATRKGGSPVPPAPLPARPNPQAAFGPPPAPAGQQQQPAPQPGGQPHPFGPPPEQPRYGRQDTPPPPGGQQYASPPQPPAGQQQQPAPGRRPDDGDDNPGEWTQMYGGNDR